MRSKSQSRFKRPSNNWHAASTGTTKLTDAKSTGIEIQQQVLTQLGAGESVPKKTFGEVAQEEIAAMHCILATSKAKPSLAITGAFCIVGFCLAASSCWTVAILGLSIRSPVRFRPGPPRCAKTTLGLFFYLPLVSLPSNPYTCTTY